MHEGAWKSRRVIDKTEDMNKQLLPLSWECYTDLEPMVTSRSSTLKANRRSEMPVGTMMIVEKEEEEKRKTRWNEIVLKVVIIRLWSCGHLKSSGRRPSQSREEDRAS